MRVSDFYFDLPSELIAYHPATERTDSRLMVVNQTSEQHCFFHQITDCFQPRDVLVLNNTRVIPARLFGCKNTGGKIELLIERVIDEHTALAHIKASKSPKLGSQIVIENVFSFTVIERQGSLYLLRLDDNNQTILDKLHKYGHIPLPPYIKRPDTVEDRKRYQTVFGIHDGSVAAPTAGLHFDHQLLEALENKGVQIVTITLHIGAGTFKPVQVDTVEEHTMHHERVEVSSKACEIIQRAKAENARVFAVGTTSARSLEAASLSGEIQPFSGETDIFIYPGYQFKTVDCMITNFHLPESTLLMMVSAFAGQENIQRAYKNAIDRKYRFFSYGDAMLLYRQPT